MTGTKICALNLHPDEIEYLEHKNIKLFNGSIGKQVTIQYGAYERARHCLPQVTLPKNLHEYNVIIIDLNYVDNCPYNEQDHTRGKNKTTKDYYFVCHKPQTLFDPRAFVLQTLRNDLVPVLKSGAMVVVFCSEDETIDYHFNMSETEHTANLYSFISDLPRHENLHGEVLKVPEQDGELFNLMKKHVGEANYHIVFHLPEIYQDQKYISNPAFVPLLLTGKRQVASFYTIHQDSGVFFFPDIKEKGAFLTSFLKDVAPIYLPKLFPEMVKDKWLEEAMYRLPNQDRLFAEKEKLKQDFQKALKDKELEIKGNEEKYNFLKQMLSCTGKELVDAIITFFKWIGFQQVIDPDSLKVPGQVLEEDIQIQTETGLIIIEVKGIFRTSTDSECSQISKIRYRRMKENKDRDIHAHYIVNHQRNKAASERTNPPFTEHQINDAKYDDRGLCTTWQLFNLFKAIEKGVITKKQARAAFYKTGYLDFIPLEARELGKPKELFKNNTIAILNMEDHPKVKVNDKILLVMKEEFETAKVLSVQIDQKSVPESDRGEVGLKFDTSIKKGASLYLLKAD
ncbi:hypothetical protein SAMN04487898_10346 [Pedobacter sp. ok626]|uniref:hypothetical protein n=1 Tax=Pedobacter sp. ok626 TaxID=1761882 RepID=UPI000885DBE8|nr:hypothetical protein [Pedobacter sp. ok626]SDJ48150.1 hypothetical protein SAMN04487898_10346 [Pedobacter sp. ok626]